MLSQFFEKLYTRGRNKETKKKDANVTPTAKGKNAKTPFTTQNRIASLSPETSAGSAQFNFRQYSPDPPSRLQFDRNITLDQQHSAISKKIVEEQNNDQTSDASEIKKEKPKVIPNFEFRPLDNPDSFVTNSALDSIREGSVLAQTIPNSAALSITKILFTGPKMDSIKSAGLKTHFDSRIFASRKENFDGKVEVLNAPLKSKAKPGSASEKRQQIWQEWFVEKKKNNQLLLEAAKLGDINHVTKLLDKKRGDLKADVNCKGENSWTPLHFACLSGNYELVKLILFHQANLDAETTLKFTPLHVAAQKGFLEIAQLLITSGADINTKDLYNNTSLHYASQNGHKKIVQLLLTKPSVDLNIKNNDYRLAYDLASNQEIRRLFEKVTTEKKILNSKFEQKVPIHNTKAENVQKMFETARIPTRRLPYESSKESQETINFDDYQKSSIINVYSKTSNDDHDIDRLNASDLLKNDHPNEKIGPHSFTVHSLLGKGSFGEVYLVEKKGTGMYYAMKVLDKSKVQKHNLVRYVLTERNVLSLTNHPFIVGLNYSFQTSDKLFLILDYCPGGDLGEHLQKERRFSEERARVYLAEIILALEDLHKRDIIFRDLKPDNIVLDAEGHAMLTDFGLSKEGVLDHVNGTKSFCGSVAYLAPEMLKRVGHGKAVDWYLLGVVFYEMLVGMPPYYANNREELFSNIERAPLKIPSNLSQEAKSLIIGLLQRNPPKRLGAGKLDAEEIKAHPFFAKINWKDVEQRKLKVPVPDKRVNFGMKIPLNFMDLGSGNQTGSGPNHISGWSFVAQQHQQKK